MVVAYPAARGQCLVHVGEHQPVRAIVEVDQQGRLARADEVDERDRARGGGWVALAAILVAGAGLGLTLSWRRKHQSGASRSGVKHDPLTATVPSARPRLGLRLPWSRPPKPAEAYLVRLRDNDQPMTSPAIPITAAETTFGSDPLHATRILDDPSVSPLHARLTQEKGAYILTDAGRTKLTGQG